MENSHGHDHTHKKECCHNNEKVTKAQLIQKILNGFNNYKPLVVILIFCILLSSVQLNPLEPQKFMYNFMGYFFCFLSLFKFFDLKLGIYLNYSR